MDSRHKRFWFIFRRHLYQYHVFHCLNREAIGSGDIFKEIKKFQGQNTPISNCIDGEVGVQNIANHFQETYENLYSQHTLEEDFDKVQQNIQERVHHGFQDDVNKVNTQSVIDALNKMKAMKSDALFDFSSDCLMNASNK